MFAKSIISIFFVCCSFASSFAQGNCLKTFNVKPGKQVSLDWLPGSQPGGKADCAAAELYRENIYLKNRDAIEKLGAVSVDAYLSLAERSVADAEKRASELESKIASNSTKAGLRIAAEVVLYAVGKAAFLTSCIAPEGVVTKFFCAGAFLSLMKDTAGILNGTVAENEYSRIAENSRAQLAQIKSRLPTLKAKLRIHDMSQVGKNAANRFADMCRAIERDCL